MQGQPVRGAAHLSVRARLAVVLRGVLGQEGFPRRADERLSRRPRHGRVHAGGRVQRVDHLAARRAADVVVGGAGVGNVPRAVASIGDGPGSERLLVPGRDPLVIQAEAHVGLEAEGLDARAPRARAVEADADGVGQRARARSRRRRNAERFGDGGRALGLGQLSQTATQFVPVPLVMRSFARYEADREPRRIARQQHLGHAGRHEALARCEQDVGRRQLGRGALARRGHLEREGPRAVRARLRPRGLEPDAHAGERQAAGGVVCDAIEERLPRPGRESRRGFRDDWIEPHRQLERLAGPQVHGHPQRPIALGPNLELAATSRQRHPGGRLARGARSDGGAASILHDCLHREAGSTVAHAQAQGRGLVALSRKSGKGAEKRQPCAAQRQAKHVSLKILERIEDSRLSLYQAQCSTAGASLLRELLCGVSSHDAAPGCLLTMVTSDPWRHSRQRPPRRDAVGRLGVRPGRPLVPTREDHPRPRALPAVIDGEPRVGAPSLTTAAKWNRGWRVVSWRTTRSARSWAKAGWVSSTRLTTPT